MDLLNFDLYSWLILPLLIFFARVIDVTLGTLRIIFVSRGKKYLAPCSALWRYSSRYAARTLSSAWPALYTVPITGGGDARWINSESTT